MLRNVKAIVLGLAVCTTAGLFVARQVSAPFSSGQYFDLAEIAARAVSCETGCDFNSDNKPDTLRVVQTPGSAAVVVTLGGIGAQSPLPLPGHGKEDGLLWAADLNGDRHLDIVWQPNVAFAAPVAWLGDGKGGFVLAAQPEPSNSDLAVVPVIPNPSSTGSANPYNLTAAVSTRTRQGRVALNKRRSSAVKARAARPRSIERDAVRPSREVALWLARTINPPPTVSLRS